MKMLFSLITPVFFYLLVKFLRAKIFAAFIKATNQKNTKQKKPTTILEKDAKTGIYKPKNNE